MYIGDQAYQLHIQGQEQHDNCSRQNVLTFIPTYFNMQLKTYIPLEYQNIMFSTRQILGIYLLTERTIAKQKNLGHSHAHIRGNGYDKPLDLICLLYHLSFVSCPPHCCLQSTFVSWLPPVSLCYNGLCWWSSILFCFSVKYQEVDSLQDPKQSSEALKQKENPWSAYLPILS